MESYYAVHRTCFLQHHGILGMRWGVRRFQNKNGSLTSAGKKRYAGKSSRRRLKLTDRQKTAIKIGAAIAITGLAAYGGYKLYKSGATLERGKPAGDAPPIFDKKDSAGFKIMDKPETLSDSLKNANPNPDDPRKANNCVYSCIAGYMRHNMQRDVIANGTPGGEQQSLGGVIEDCFKGAVVKDGSAIKFGRSPEDASEFLIKRFGQNASGVCSIQWKGKHKDERLGGHAFSWEIKDGVVRFMDYRYGRDHEQVKNYWRRINPNDSFTVARLDIAEPILDKMNKYASNR